MTRFRTWLADLVTGGDYSARRKRLEGWLLWRDASTEHWMDKAERYGTALDEIAAMETPKANATVRRMAARAREARHGDHRPH